MSPSCQDVVGELQIRYEDHQLGAVYGSQIKAKTLLGFELLQHFEEAVEYLAYRAFVWKLEDLILNGVKDQDVKHLLRVERSSMKPITKF
jgi:hypothetical protein